MYSTGVLAPKAVGAMKYRLQEDIRECCSRRERRGRAPRQSRQHMRKLKDIIKRRIKKGGENEKIVTSRTMMTVKQIKL